MNWQKQTEEMFKTWTETQKKMWENWTESLKNLGTGAGPTPESWTKMVDTWQGMVKSALDSQGKWAQMWVDNMTKIEGMPDNVVKWAEQSKEMTTRWNETQAQLWDNWFDMLKKVEPSALGVDGQKMFKTWQDTTQEMMKAQTEWVKSLSAGETAAGGKK